MSYPPIPEETHEPMRNALIEALRLLVDQQGLRHHGIDVSAFPFIEWWVLDTGDHNIHVEVKANILIHDEDYKMEKMK